MYGSKGISQTGVVSKQKEILSADEFKKHAIECLNKVHQLSLKKLRHQVFPTVTFELKGERVLGRANYLANTIELNLEMLRHNPHEIEDTIIHEYCHLLDKKVFDGWGHSATWKKLMKELGGNPFAKANDIDTSYAVKKPEQLRKHYVYNCGCSEHYFTEKKHNQARKKGVYYNCLKCKTRLFFKKAVMA